MHWIMTVRRDSETVAMNLEARAGIEPTSTALQAAA